jgi:hypothetical protein
MIFGSNFNIAHMPKTGGTYLRSICARLPKRVIPRIYPSHLACDKLTPEEALKPTYIFVRNPFDWYVSLYSHWHGNITRKIHEFRPNGPPLTPLLKNVKERYSGSFEKSLSGLGDTLISPHTGEPLKSFSDQFDRFSQKKGSPVIALKFEDGVRDGLHRILKTHQPQALNSHFMRLLKHHKPLNVSQRSDYKNYYSVALREKVEEVDSEVLEKFGYRF